MRMILNPENARRCGSIATALNNAAIGHEYSDVLGAMVVFVASGIFEHVAGDRKAFLEQFASELSATLTMLERDRVSGADATGG